MSHCPIRRHLHQSYPGVKIPTMDQWGMFPIHTPDKHFFPRFSAVGDKGVPHEGNPRLLSAEKRPVPGCGGRAGRGVTLLFSHSAQG